MCEVLDDMWLVRQGRPAGASPTHAEDLRSGRSVFLLWTSANEQLRCYGSTNTDTARWRCVAKRPPSASCQTRTL